MKSFKPVLILMFFILTLCKGSDLSEEVKHELAETGEKFDIERDEKVKSIAMSLGIVFGTIVIICLWVLYCCFRKIYCFKSEHDVGDWDEMWEDMRPVLGSNSQYRQVEVKSTPSYLEIEEEQPQNPVISEPPEPLPLFVLEDIDVQDEERSPERIHRRSSQTSKASKRSHRSHSSRRSKRPKRSS